MSLPKRLVFVDPILTRGQTWYYNQYCSATSPCDRSIKGELDIDTGAFIIYNVQLTDEDYYYYAFVHPITGPGDTILKYEVNLRVYGKCLQIKIFIRNFVECTLVLFANCHVYLKLHCELLNVYWRDDFSALSGQAFL